MTLVSESSNLEDASAREGLRGGLLTGGRLTKLLVALPESPPPYTAPGPKSVKSGVLGEVSPERLSSIPAQFLSWDWRRSGRPRFKLRDWCRFWVLENIGSVVVGFEEDPKGNGKSLSSSTS